MGRHFNIFLLFLVHNAMQSNITKLLLLESHGIILFPQNMSGKSSKYLLDQYLGLDKDQIKKINKYKVER
jgi:hypothetical protein